jgi:transposase
MNQLNVKRQQSIIALFEQGWSKRRIARELGVDRLTVRRYLAAAVSKSPTPQTGSTESTEAKSPTDLRTGSPDDRLAERGEYLGKRYGLPIFRPPLGCGLFDPARKLIGAGQARAGRG